MLSEDLLAIISELETEYPRLYRALRLLSCECDPKFLRAGLLDALNLQPVGTPRGRAIHRTLRELTRIYPMNRECPITFEEIDLSKVDTYFAFSTGMILSRTPEYVQSLMINPNAWFYPTTREAYSLHDIDYIETVCNIKKPSVPKLAVMTPRGPVVLLPNGGYFYARESGLEPVPNEISEDIIDDVRHGRISTYPSLEALRESWVITLRAPQQEIHMRELETGQVFVVSRSLYSGDTPQETINDQGQGNRRRGCVIS